MTDRLLCVSVCVVSSGLRQGRTPQRHAGGGQKHEAIARPRKHGTESHSAGGDAELEGGVEGAHGLAPLLGPHEVDRRRGERRLGRSQAEPIQRAGCGKRREPIVDREHDEGGGGRGLASGSHRSPAHAIRDDAGIPSRERDHHGHDEKEDTRIGAARLGIDGEEGHEGTIGGHEAQDDE
jgi:hypothetical protein